MFLIMLCSKEIAKSARTLICLLQSLVDHRVLVELRNDYFILGILQSVDSYMNAELSSAYIWSLDDWIQEKCDDCDINEIVIKTDQLPELQWIEKQNRMDYLLVKGSRIRYFYLPKEISITDCIEEQLAVYRRPRQTFERPFNWKTYRKKLKLEKYQGKVQSTPDEPKSSSMP